MYIPKPLSRKLMIVKIKNYVIEKWRPKKVAEEGNYSTFKEAFTNMNKISKTNDTHDNKTPKTNGPAQDSSDGRLAAAAKTSDNDSNVKPSSFTRR